MPGFIEAPSDIAGRMAARLAEVPVPLACERSCILVLVEGRFRAALIAANLDEAMAEARRRRSDVAGGASLARAA